MESGNGAAAELGAALLAEALKWAQTFQATQAILEVRASNLAALRFYERHKFEVVGRRPRYYTAPVEDALLLTATLGQQLLCGDHNIAARQGADSVGG